MRCIKIVYWGGKGLVKEFSLDRNVTRAVIGRDPRCEICIPSPFFNPRHAIVEWDGDAAYVAYVRFPPGNQTDLNVDGESLGNERIELMIGSELSIGDQVFAMTCMSKDEVELPPADGLRFPDSSRSQNDADDGRSQGSSRGQAPSRGGDDRDDWDERGPKREARGQAPSRGGDDWDAWDDQGPKREARGQVPSRSGDGWDAWDDDSSRQPSVQEALVSDGDDWNPWGDSSPKREPKAQAAPARDSWDDEGAQS
ncbi:MAG: FHA domain-containing protein, partial [Proteobacteria bacterium]|nr:FHA domain-containing protein [Pseudomonadota bacterium]